MRRLTIQLLCLVLAIAPQGLPLHAQDADRQAFLGSIPPEFPPSSLPWLLDVALAELPRASVENLALELRRKPDLAASLTRLEERFLAHRLAQSPAEARLEAVREVRYQSPIARLAEDLARSLPDLADTPANTALRSVGHKLAHRYLKAGVKPQEMNDLLIQATNLQAAAFLQAAGRFLRPELLHQADFAAVPLEQQADLARNILAGGLIDSSSSVIQIEGSPSVGSLIGLGRKALDAHAELLAKEAQVLAQAQTTASGYQQSADALQQELERRRGDIQDLGEALRRAVQPSPEDKERYQRLAEELLRDQSFLEALTTGSLPSLAGPGPTVALGELIPPDLRSLQAEIVRIAAAPAKLAAGVDQLFETGRQAMKDLDAFAAGAKDLSFNVQVEGARFDAGKLASGVFQGCFEAAIESSGLTVDLGGGQLDVGALVGGLAGNDLLAAVGGSSFTVDLGGNSVNVLGVATSLATGNFLGAIGGLFGSSGSPFGGLFGGGGQDLKMIRQQLEQIQRALEQISRQLARIEQKLDAFREEFRQAHLEVMAKLDQISLDLTTVRIANLSFFETQAASCETTASILVDKSYEQARQIVNNALFRQVETCQDYVLNKVHQPRAPIELTLLLNEGRDDRAAKVRRDLYDRYLLPHLDLFEAAFRRSERQRASAMLLDAQPTFDSLRRRQEQLRSSASTPPQSPVDAVLGTVFDPYQIIDPAPLSEFVRHVFLVQQISPFFNFKRKWFVTPGCLMTGAGCVGSQRYPNLEITKARLVGTLRLVNTALAQQALFNGDLLLSKASSALKSGANGSSDSKNLDRILAGNPIFAANLTHSILRDRMASRRFCARASQYALARLYAEESGEDMTFLNLLFSNGDNGDRPTLSFFVNQPSERAGLQGDARKKEEEELQSRCDGALPGAQGVYAVLPGAHCTPVPTQKDFESGTLQVTPAWTQAAALRSQLLDELAGYTFRSTLKPEERKAYDSLLLLHRSLEPPATGGSL